jgi:hypothetical protein
MNITAPAIHGMDLYGALPDLPCYQSMPLTLPGAMAPPDGPIKKRRQNPATWFSPSQRCGQAFPKRLT